MMVNTPKLHVVAGGPPVVADPDAGGIEYGSSEEIRAELCRVLNSPQFDASERNRRFLEYVVEETLAGRAERIKAYNVATTVFGREDSFDPQLDPVVRMEARRLRRSLERLYLVEGSTGKMQIALPKGGYVPRCEKPGAVPRRSPAATQTAPGEAFSYRGPSILVSVFEAEDESPVSTNYGDGFVRQLAVGLSRFPEFSIFTPRTTSTFGAEQPGHAPIVDLVLSGDTSATSDAFKAKATLVHARSGKVIWGETLEQGIGAKGILEARDRVGDRIVRFLAGYLSATGGSDCIDLAEKLDRASFESLVHFHRYRRSRRKELFPAARERLEKAAASDPGYSETHACLSQIYSDGYRFGFASMEARAELPDQALEVALKAVELSPTSSRAHHALGIASWCLGDADASVAELRTAVALNPNATDAMADLGLQLCLLGDWSGGVRLIEESLVGTPAQLGIHRVGLSLHHFSNGHFEQALAEANRIDTPCITHGFVAQAISLVRLGRRSEAQGAVARILGVNPRYGREVLHEFGGRNVHPTLAHEIKSALRDAGLAPISAAS